MAPQKISQLSQQLKNPRSALILVALGLVVIAIVIATKSGPTHNGDQPTTSTASFIYAKSQPIAPSVTGHGIVRAATNHKAIAEVSGRLVEISELLQPGVFVEAGALLAAIDATDYQLALEQAKANQVSAESTLSELAQRQSTLEATLDLVSENLRITQKELKRKTDLLKRGAISQSLVDSERRNVIVQQQEKVNLERDLAILPSQIAMAQAQLDSSLATIELQQRNIERTRFHMPFNGRIAAIDAEQDQFVSAGHLLFTANS
ncbi:MAG: hypothetical protein VXZ35_11095, partial [Pseudomonadota bacterium]|nr:hypothetical protein [Pseudomonadota bacterium]